MSFNLFKKNVTNIFIYKYIFHMLFPFYYLIKNPSVYFPIAIFVHKVDSFPLPVQTVINLPLDCLLIFFFHLKLFFNKYLEQQLGFC